MKNQKGSGFYCSILAGIIEIAALVAYAVLASDGEAAPATVYVLSILGLVAQAAALLLAGKRGETPVADLLGWCAAILYATAPVVMIQARMAVIVNVFANHVGTVGMPIIVAAVLFVAALLVKMVSGFMALSKNAS